MQRAIGILIATVALVGCAREARILYAPAASSLDLAVFNLQQSISDAEERRCRVRSVSVGAGQGVGVGLGLGLGVGLNIAADCPDCAAQNLNQTVVQRESRVVSESTFAAVALAFCPAGAYDTHN